MKEKWRFGGIDGNDDDQATEMVALMTESDDMKYRTMYRTMK